MGQNNAFGELISSTYGWPDEVLFGYQTNWLALPGMTTPAVLVHRPFMGPYGIMGRAEIRHE